MAHTRSEKDLQENVTGASSSVTTNAPEAQLESIFPFGLFLVVLARFLQSTQQESKEAYVQEMATPKSQLWVVGR